MIKCEPWCPWQEMAAARLSPSPPSWGARARPEWTPGPPSRLSARLPPSRTWSRPRSLTPSRQKAGHCQSLSASWLLLDHQYQGDSKESTRKIIDNGHTSFNCSSFSSSNASLLTELATFRRLTGKHLTHFLCLPNIYCRRKIVLDENIPTVLSWIWIIYALMHAFTNTSKFAFSLFWYLSIFCQ